LLVRLEICTFFRLIKNEQNDFTLILASEVSKDFIRIFLEEEYFVTMAVKAELKENLTKFKGYN